MGHDAAQLSRFLLTRSTRRVHDSAMNTTTTRRTFAALAAAGALTLALTYTRTTTVGVDTTTYAGTWSE
jgi:hypothetical protein